MKIKNKILYALCFLLLNVTLCGYEPLFKAVRDKDPNKKVLEVLEDLRTEAKKNNQDEKTFVEQKINEKNKSGLGSTALMIASQNNEVGIVKILLDAGANPDITDNTHKTALMYAVELLAVYVVKLLIEGGANLNIKSGFLGCTALIYAVINFNQYMNEEYVSATEEILEMLLKAHPNTNIQDYEGNTALHLIIAHNDMRSVDWIIKLLLKNGASPRIANNNGITAEMLARQQGFTLEN